MDLIRLNCGHHWGFPSNISRECTKCKINGWYPAGGIPPHEMHKAAIIGEKATPEQQLWFDIVENRKHIIENRKQGAT